MANKDFGQVIKESDPDILDYGTATFTTTAAQITETSTKIGQGVWIRALSTNTNVVYVGSDDDLDNTNGYPLIAGEEKFIIINDLSKVWFYGGAAGQEIRYLTS
jgi:hypothetical protein